MRDLGDSCDVEGEEIRITDRFGVDRFGFVGDGGGHSFGVRLDEVDVDAEFRQRVGEQVVGTAVEAGR